MLIDWFTVIAQTFNFFILVWLMKRFLYKPILNAIDAREKRIADELANADKKKAEAQKESDAFKRKNEEFDKQRDELFRKAKQDAESSRQKLLEEARKSADALSAHAQESLRNDAKNLNQAISRRAQQEVFSISRKVLSDLSSFNLEKSMTEVFVSRLQKMDIQSKKVLTDALKSSSASGLVRSTFDLSLEQQTAIQNALNVTFSMDIHLTFKTSPDLIGGIEFIVDGQRLSWSIADYLKSLEEGVNELIKDKENSKAKPGAKKV